MESESLAFPGREVESASRLSVLKQVRDWGNETCYGLDMSPLKRRECDHCWGNLESEIAELEK